MGDLSIFCESKGHLELISSLLCKKLVRKKESCCEKDKTEQER